LPVTVTNNPVSPLTATAFVTFGKRESGTERPEEARGAISLAWSVYREAELDQYETSFETRLRLIDDLIASRRSGS